MTLVCVFLFQSIFAPFLTLELAYMGLSKYFPKVSYYMIFCDVFLCFLNVFLDEHTLDICAFFKPVKMLNDVINNTEGDCCNMLI